MVVGSLLRAMPARCGTSAIVRLPLPDLKEKKRTQEKNKNLKKMVEENIIIIKEKQKKLTYFVELRPVAEYVEVRQWRPGCSLLHVVVRADSNRSSCDHRVSGRVRIFCFRVPWDATR